MNNQLLRIQKRQDEETKKRLNEKATRLLIHLNQLILQYHRTLEVYISRTENGSLIPKFKVVRTDSKGIQESTRFLLSKGVNPPERVFNLQSTTMFSTKLQQYQTELNITILPTLQVGQFGIIPGYIFAEQKTTSVLDNQQPNDEQVPVGLQLQVQE